MASYLHQNYPSRPTCVYVSFGWCTLIDYTLLYCYLISRIKYENVIVCFILVVVFDTTVAHKAGVNSVFAIQFNSDNSNSNSIPNPVQNP